MNNDDNYDEETTCLNSVNITSNVRAPGEYKYYQCGENNSSHLYAKDIKIETNDINNTNKLPNINIIVKIFFGAGNYLLFNVFDKRIILIDIFNRKFITLFNNKETKTPEPLYNIINTFDENYIF